MSKEKKFKCGLRRLCSDENCQKCFEKSFANHPYSIYWSEKNEITPRNIFMTNSDIKCIFHCPFCDHDFKKTTGSVYMEQWCPYCANKKLCDKEDCDFCFENSFASHPRSKYWSNKNESTPRQTLKNSNKKAWLSCDCEHDFLAEIGKITKKKLASWCPYCANKKLCGDENCQKCFEKSLASVINIEKWSYKNEISSHQVFKNSEHSSWFYCDECDHNFNARITDVNRNPNYCPFCCPAVRQLCDKEDCDFCYKRSFASHKNSKLWSGKNNISSRRVATNSALEFWFTCDKCYDDYQAKVYSISKGHGCPNCKHKTETKLFNALTDKNIKLCPQVRFDWCRSNKTSRQLPFDFVIEKYKIIIELDGDQHFKQVRDWKTPEEQQEVDLYKMDCANNNGYTIIRILQMDVWRDRNNWLENILKKMKLYKKPTRIFISDGNEYAPYQQT